jgi:hypothetical protein
MSDRGWLGREPPADWCAGTSRLVHIRDVYRQIKLNVYRVPGVGRVRNRVTSTRPQTLRRIPEPSRDAARRGRHKAAIA